MGTNYYCWNGVMQEQHIGKSSAGWCFSLRVYEDQGILSLYDWLPHLVHPETVIRDEYGRHITATDMLQTITCRSRDTPPNFTQSDWEVNQAELGPNNLLRHRQYSDYGRTCTHGEGTWDYCDYEFS
jgi:hypothetical protein